MNWLQLTHKCLTVFQLWVGVFTFCLIAWVSLGILQYGMGLEPCSMCLLQRIPLGIITLISLIGMLTAKRAMVTALLAAAGALSSMLGMWLAYTHVKLQSLPAELRPTVCFPELTIMVEEFGMQEAVSLVLNGDADCAIIQWQLLGITIPEQSLILFTLLILILAVIGWLAIGKIIYLRGN